MYSCSDWTDMEQARHTDLTEIAKSETFYENLREYKKSDHSVAFGWFGGWTGGDASMVSSLKGLPDSVDFVSIWGGWDVMTPEKKLDMEYVQQKKGTKILFCFIIANIGDQLTPVEVRNNYEENGFATEEEAVKDYWGWKDEEPETIELAIKKYANAICDIIDEFGYDGFDIDYEPHYGGHGNMASYGKRMLLLIQTMRSRLGEDKMLVLDGQPDIIPSESGPLLDYFIVQAYDSPGYKDLDSRLKSTIKNFEGYLTPEEVANRYIVTENFEKYAQSGGRPDYVDQQGNKMPSVEGMARWTPIINGKKVRKGGVGTYHMEYEYTISGKEGTYPALRNAIRIMNPPII